MEQWIATLIGYATAPMRELLTAISERVSWVYSLIVRVLTSVRNAHNNMFDAVANFRNWITWAIGEGFLTAKWIITIRLPAMVSNARTQIIQWAVTEITRAGNAIRSLLTILDQWVKAQVARLFRDLADLRRWATNELNVVIDVLRRVRDIVFTLLTSPKRLAAWLVGAMIGEMWKYANNNADRIALWVRAKSVKYTLQAASQIESIIARLL